MVIMGVLYCHFLVFGDKNYFLIFFEAIEVGPKTRFFDLLKFDDSISQD